MQTTLRVPEILQQLYGIADEPGRYRALPRSLMSYNPPRVARGTGRVTEADRRGRPPRKLEFLAVAWTLMMSGALPADGDYRKWTPKEVRQEQLGAMLGISRPAFTRLMSRMSNGHGKHGGLGAAVEMLMRFRNYGGPNRYMLGAAVPAEASRPGRSDISLYTYPTVGDLCAHPVTGVLFSDEPGCGGYKLIPLWIFDWRLPQSLVARIVLVYYCTCGLLERGECQVRQARVARALGISVRSVRRANAEWVEAGLIRAAHPPPVIHPDGRIERGPQIIVFLPMRTLDSETAAAETRRLLACRNRLLGQYAHFWDGICRLHRDLLGQWVGHEHSMAGFWNAVRRELAAGGVPEAAIAAVIPFRSD